MPNLDNPNRCDVDSTVVADSPAEWWHPYLAKYVAHVGAPAGTLATHHHFYAFMAALARKFDAAMGWSDDGRDRRWYVSPPELDGAKCYLPGTECGSVAWCSFADALEDISTGWLTAGGLPRILVNSEGKPVHHDPVATLLTIAGEAGEDVAALNEQVRSHAVASGPAQTTGGDSIAPRPPSSEISSRDARVRRGTRKRASRNKPDATAETGNLFGAV